MFQLAMFPLIEPSTGVAKETPVSKVCGILCTDFLLVWQRAAAAAEGNRDCCRWHFPVGVKKENWGVGGGRERNLLTRSRDLKNKGQLGGKKTRMPVLKRTANY